MCGLRSFLGAWEKRLSTDLLSHNPHAKQFPLAGWHLKEPPLQFTTTDALLVNDGWIEGPKAKTFKKVFMFSPPCGEGGTGVSQVSMRAGETEITEVVGRG